MKFRKFSYARVRLSPRDIEKQSYKKFFGGGEEKWEKRGAFQLFFLKSRGLLPSHRLLDVGCGPLRAGEHLIGYLDPHRYCGIDYNADFIRTAREIVARKPDLAEKQPALAQVNNFDFSPIPGLFDYVIVFSVLNHCDPAMIARFFRELPRLMDPATRVYLTHARWFEEELLAGSQLRLATKFTSAAEISPGLDMEEWGWPPTESIFPILELRASS